MLRRQLVVVVVVDSWSVCLSVCLWTNLDEIFSVGVWETGEVVTFLASKAGFSSFSVIESLAALGIASGQHCFYFFSFPFIQGSVPYTMLWRCRLGGGRGIRPVKYPFQQPKRFSFGGFWGPGLTWSKVWKNRLVKEKPKVSRSGECLTFRDLHFDEAFWIQQLPTGLPCCWFSIRTASGDVKDRTLIEEDVWSPWSNSG